MPTEETDGHDADLRAALTALVRSAHVVRVADASSLGDVPGMAAAVLSPRQPDVRVLRLYSGNDVAFMVNNEGSSPAYTDATFPVGRTPEIWDPRTGSTATAPQFDVHGQQTTLPLRLDPYETSIVVFRQATPSPQDVPHLVAGGAVDGLDAVSLTAADDSVTADVTATAPGSYPLVATANGEYLAGTVRVADPLAPVALDGDWTMQLGSTSTSGPLGSWTGTHPTYSGSATYRHGIDLTASQLAGHRWTLDLGDVRDVADVSVNGHVFDPVLWQPYRLDVTDALHAGSNDVSVTVTNTLANTHGDSRPSGLL
ncbi:MAG TPA: hypothetical protein VEL02_00615, partial [Jatrophihabitantaceae bacterium]|nr:hypothetical protein [Jatrophihabitantaceae bacterium]